MRFQPKPRLHTIIKTPKDYRKSHPRAAFITFEKADCCVGLEDDKDYMPPMPDIPQLALLSIVNGRGSINEVEVLGEKALTWWTSPGRQGGPVMQFDKPYAHVSVAVFNLLPFDIAVEVWGHESPDKGEFASISIPRGEHLIVANELFHLEKIQQISLFASTAGLGVHYLMLV